MDKRGGCPLNRGLSGYNNNNNNNNLLIQSWSNRGSYINTIIMINTGRQIAKNSKCQ